VEGSQNVSQPDTTSQATTAPDVTGRQSQTGQTPEQQLQAALSGMGAAQREKAEWLNVAKEYGFNSAAEAKQAFETYRAVNDPNQAGIMVKNYLAQNPDALTTLLRENPMQAAQIMGQVFNNQQPQASPYENITTYDEFGNVVVKQSTDAAVKQVTQQYDPRLTAVENFIKQQHESQVKTQLNPKIPEAVRESVWNEVKKIGIPMATIEAQPWLIDGLVVQLSGGREKYEESIRTAAAAETAKKVTDKVIQNNNVASLTPGGGVSVSEINGPITDPDARRREAMRRIDLMQTVTGGS
jgi:membrane-associated HD superfamily phosphohydrolase